MLKSNENLSILKKALEEVAESSTDKFPTKEEAASVTFSENFEHRMKKLIRRHNNGFCFSLKKVAKVAACFVVVGIALTVITSSVKASPDAVPEFRVKTYEKYSKITYKEKDITKAFTIEEVYAPSYIPEGYSIKKEEASNSSHRVKYRKSKHELIYFEQILLFNELYNIDTEDAYTEYIEISGYKAFYVQEDDRHIVYWNDKKYGYLLTICGGLSRDELIKIAESLKIK